MEFTGRYYYSVDTKGRVMVPAAFRELIATAPSPKLHITVAATDKCIQIYPHEGWTELISKVRTQPQHNPVIKRFMRIVIGSAVEDTFDRQGRVLLPASLRQDLGISGDVVIVGQLGRIEVWDRAEWQRSTAYDESDNDSFAEALSGLGI